MFSFNRLASDISGAFGTNFEAVDHVEAVDAYTVKFTLKHPFAPFPHVRRLPREPHPARGPRAVRGDLRTVDCARKAGGGPWLLDLHQPSVQLVYVKNPDYYNAPKPYFDRIVAPIITNSSVSLAAFTAQKIYSGVSMNATQAETLKAQLPSVAVDPGRYGENGSMTAAQRRTRAVERSQSSPGGQHGAQPPELHRHRAAG